MTLNNKDTAIIFKCIMCGSCCKGYGGTYVGTEDIKKMVLFLKTTSDNFMSQYTQQLGRKIILTQKDNGFCIFWDKKNGCLIHPVKPNMCKRWPFLQSVLTDILNWKIMANSCPGIKTSVKNNQITNCIETHIKQNPSIYDATDANDQYSI